MAETVHSQRFTVSERFAGADGMQAAKQLPQAVELVEVARLRGMAATAREQREAKALVLEQGAAGVLHGRYDRHFAIGQFSGKAVFFEDGRIAPAARPVELGDQRLRPSMPTW